MEFQVLIISSSAFLLFMLINFLIAFNYLQTSISSLYTADIPRHPHTLLASFANDKAILSSHDVPNIDLQNLQDHLTSPP